MDRWFCPDFKAQSTLSPTYTGPTCDVCYRPSVQTRNSSGPWVKIEEVLLTKRKDDDDDNDDAGDDNEAYDDQGPADDDNDDDDNNDDDDDDDQIILSNQWSRDTKILHITPHEDLDVIVCTYHQCA